MTVDARGASRNSHGKMEIMSPACRSRCRAGPRWLGPLWLGVLAAFTSFACESQAIGAREDDPSDPSQELPETLPLDATGEEPEAAFAVGTLRIEIDAHDGRRLPVQLWYPATDEAREEARAGHSVEAFEPEGERRARLAALLEAAPEGCTNRTMHAALEATPAASEAPFPLLAFSHHHEGVRFAMFTIAERLASLGFVVAAPDHEESTVYSHVDDLLHTLSTFTPEFLKVRVADLRNVLDVMLDPTSAAVPESLRGRMDAGRVGVYGHSMGGLTSGSVEALDLRVKAAAYLSVPSENALLETPGIESFRVPGLYFFAQEDAVISVFGPDVVRGEFEAQAPEAWLVEVHDTGHWSFSDDCALISDFANGCGTEARTSELFLDDYENLDNAQARAIAAHYVAAFFAHQFLGTPADALEQATPSELVSVDHREAHAP